MHLVRTLVLAIGLWASAALAWAQTEQSRTISWLPAPSLPAGGAAPALPAFEESAFLGREPIPYYLLSLPNATVGSFEFTQQEFVSLTEIESRSFPKKSLSSAITPSITAGTANRVEQSVVAFQPFRLNPQTGAVEKLVRFSFRYTPGISASRKGPGSAAARRTYATRSVLNSGEWYKIGVPASGMYKLDRAALQALGLNLQGLNPRHLKLYGNGGGMLPQPNATPRPDDLVENAIWIEGEQDGSFDTPDYLLFYGEGPHTWSLNPAPGQAPFLHSNHLYTDTTYYFLTVGTSPGLRVAQQASLNGNFPVISTYDERWFHEVDLKNLVNSGREWYGEEFTAFAPQKSFTIPASDLVPNSTVWLTSAVMANSPVGSAFAVRLNGAVQGTHEVSGRGTFSYHPEGVNHFLQFSPNLASLGYNNDLSVVYTYDPKGSSSATGYLNFFTVAALRQLRLYGNQNGFRSLASRQQTASTYQVSGVSSDVRIWNVTDPLKPFRQTVALSNGMASFSANSQPLQEYVAFQGNSFPAPSLHGRVVNQNLHSLNLDGKLDLLVLTPAAFSGQAQRLANYRSSQAGLQAAVVLLPQIYQEFSSGKQDITAIRDFLKMVYERSNKQGDDLLQVILLGDASFDPKNRLPQNTNFIPIYESRQSLDPVLSYSSDDYIGFLDDQEGEWSETNFSLGHYLDVGIGRLPVKSAAEADLAIDKLMRYDSEQALGNWRKRLVFLADDGDTNEHLNDAEYLAEFVERLHSAYLPQKIYLDLFPQVSVPNGQRAPETNKALREAIERGALVTNYTGHGNAISLAEEQILTLGEIQSWKNHNRLTFFLTATCEFGRYDDPRRNSGAETVLFHPEGGAVGLLTTTRPVYSDGNRALNTNFFSFLFTPLADGRMPTLGVLTNKTKNASLFGVNNRNFALLGDPSMRLAYPDQEIVLSKLNGKPFSPTSSDTLKALSTIRIEGFVKNSQGQPATNFQGQVHLTVYDKRAPLTTLGDQNAKKQVLSRTNVLYDGLASVKNGVFEIAMVIPKDINYQFGAGSIHLYAFSSGNNDAHGATPVPVGGASTDVTADNTPPEISLYMNDESFVSGGLTGKDGTLLAHLFDDNGINTAGAGIGHEITAILDEKSTDPIILNEFYTADVDSYQSGKVRYPLKDLAVGPHTLTLKAWDTHNNSSTSKLEFIVASHEKLTLEHVLNIPNPFVNKTTFHFDHNRPGQPLDILIQIYTVSGRLVKSLHGVSDGSAHFSDITWDGRDDSNDILGKGVYIYKVNVRSRLDGSNSSRFEKLVLLK